MSWKTEVDCKIFTFQRLTIQAQIGIIPLANADVAHPVERHLAKVEVASSSLVIRSIFSLEAAP